MAGITVDSEALGQAATALGKYIADVQQNIKKMQDAATDCNDNMGKDVYSQRAIEKLQSCAMELSKTVEQAEDLRKRILKKKREIDDSVPNF